MSTHDQYRFALPARRLSVHRRIAVGMPADSDVGLPEGTVVFSADNHISLAADIFYERFPDDLKDKAPRIWYEDGAYQVGRKGQSFLPGDFSAVLMQYDDLPGAASTNIEARIQELHDDGVDKELAQPRSREVDAPRNRPFQITQRLPVTDGEPQYRIRSSYVEHEFAASESELRPAQLI